MQQLWEILLFKTIMFRKVFLKLNLFMKNIKLKGDMFNSMSISSQESIFIFNGYINATNNTIVSGF